MPTASPLEGYAALSALINQLDEYLPRKHPEFFGPRGYHPALPVRRAKVIHDNLWGTNRFSWRELVLIDSPILQRLRDIHQVGLAFQVYPSARHTRFEHSLGVVTLASRIFEALLQREAGEIRNIAQVIAPGIKAETTILHLRQELRLAALLHDTGHSLFSHASEQVYGELKLLREASGELTALVGKEKGAGEVIAFCMAQTRSVAEILARAKTKVFGDTLSEDYDGEIDMANVALIIVGRSKHPFLQFLGDIVSSGFDADKLDYLVRDATAAGLPLRYDLERYLYAVRLERNILADGKGKLERLYRCIGKLNIERRPPQPGRVDPYYETYRLRLPRQAMNTIEQIVICKLMLYSYIYHHKKVRSAEGMLGKMLERMVRHWRGDGETDTQILERFLTMTDSVLRESLFAEAADNLVRQYSYRLVNRLLPREAFRFSSADASYAERAPLTDFLTSLQDKDERGPLKAKLEQAIGEELLTIDPALGPTSLDALGAAGVWVDVPTETKFEDVDELLVGGIGGVPGVPLVDVFPIRQWTQAYKAFKYQVRIFAFSERLLIVQEAAKKAMQRVIGIQGDSFYNKIKPTRS